MFFRTPFTNYTTVHQRERRAHQGFPRMIDSPYTLNIASLSKTQKEITKPQQLPIYRAPKKLTNHRIIIVSSSIPQVFVFPEAGGGGTDSLF